MSNICYVCNKATATPHSHHTHLQAYGGKNSRTVTLCPTHHSLIHSLADKGITDYAWETEQQRNRGQPLVNHAIASKKSETRLFKIWYEVDAEKRRKLGVLKTELGLKSIEKTVDFCVDAVMKKIGVV